MPDVLVTSSTLAVSKYVHKGMPMKNRLCGPLVPKDGVLFGLELNVAAEIRLGLGALLVDYLFGTK